MITETMDPTTVTYLVDKFGFPIGVAIILLCVIITLVMLIVRSIIDRQKTMDKFYFKNIDDKLDRNNTSLENIYDKLTTNLLEMKEISLKLCECKDRIDSLESRSIAYIFREGSINRIKNNREIDVTRDMTEIVAKNTI